MMSVLSCANGRPSFSTPSLSWKLLVVIVVPDAYHSLLDLRKGQ